MSAPLPWLVFRVSDCDWWLARTLEEAKESVTDFYGSDEAFDTDYVGELSEADLDRLKYQDDLCDENSVTRTFREELAVRVAAGVIDPELFASTEY